MADPSMDLGQVASYRAKSAERRDEKREIEVEQRTVIN